MRKPQKRSPKEALRIRRQKDAFVDAAYLLFLAKGVDKTTMADIASHAKSTRKTLFTYFPSKQLLLLEILERYNDEVLVNLDSYLSAKPSGAVEYIVGFIDTHIQIRGTFDELHLWRELEAARITISNNSDLDKRELIIMQRLTSYYELMVATLVREGFLSQDVNRSDLANLITASVTHTFHMVLHNLYDGPLIALAGMTRLIRTIVEPYEIAQRQP